MSAQSIDLLNRGAHLSLTNGTFQDGSRWKHFFSPQFHRQEVERVAKFAEHQILHGTPEERRTFLSLGNAFINRYQSDSSVAKIIQAFDRQIAPKRDGVQYLHPQNQKAFAKWVQAGLPPEIFHRFPSFAEHLEESLLLSQIKITRDTLRIIDGEPALLVEGNWLKAPDYLLRFQVVNSKAYGQKFVVEKETREVYSYLDNGQGLQKHHPFISTNTPISTLNEDEYQRTWMKGCAFIRPGEERVSLAGRAALNRERPFILQCVTSRVNHGQSNIDKLFRNPKHPYLRIIIGQANPVLGTKKGEVYEAGYGWKTVPFLPFVATNGRFRSPDLWEFKTPEERIVTNIPLTQQEAREFFLFTLKYHRDGVNLGIEPGFHLTDQNCSVYTREACRAAGIEIPTEIDFKEALDRISPERIRNIGHQLSQWAGTSLLWLQRHVKRFIPEKTLSSIAPPGSKLLEWIGKTRDVFIAFILTPLRALLGGACGQGGSAFRQPHERPVQIRPPLHHWRNFFDLSSYKMHLPGIAQEWQLKQPSTVIYKNQTRLAIVPPP